MRDHVRGRGEYRVPLANAGMERGQSRPHSFGIIRRIFTRDSPRRSGRRNRRQALNSGG
jgi:hypothetical protein